ncbi:N-alpha-acetyl-L-2,4-diaminobutyric acid deacetylase [Roseobacter fucihabitans]|uniref:N-alpha-acetyl-L-2,4-diaminobutyric acid deacetylase n=1 Tax=Roseobacter fucihabitans TaxID=1537242 RepID=A0ABZ2BRB8_9RHOB|nr:N(2)-acetyl-L-2,4-diaminobutanoate deacetylase DoeB [Roseobacter litoralis]MBC6965380.1 Succinylglutamate desuccinylase / Aspartoacylase family protein [Roseobacter litoralis]
MRDNPICASVDFDQDGVQHGHLRLPHSRDDSAWGSVMIPICVLKNGAGPTALFTGGNHGDEYEGPLALSALAQSLQPREIKGRVIILPFMNQPAFAAGTRVSPLDQGNMNRMFPGRPDGTPTQKIADYFQRILLPMADIVLDFHSGGKTLDFLPFAASHVLEDKAQEAQCRAARDAFNAPFSLEMREIDSLGMYDDAAEGLGKIFVTTELGGGGTATPDTTAIARKGVRNLLIHAGILAEELDLAPTRHLSQPDGACFHFAQDAGLIEFHVHLGDKVTEGDTLARIWGIHHLNHAPLVVPAQMDGIVTARHHPGLIQAGDCLTVLSVEHSP